MFDKENFSKLLKKAIGSNRTISQFSKDCQVARPYISKFLNCKLDKPPSQEIIKKFASAATNFIHEEILLECAGYIDNLEFADHMFGSDDRIAEIDYKINSRYEENKSKDIIMVEVPVLSYIESEKIICPNRENIESFECVSKSIIYDAEKCFYYIVSDNSMENCRIYENDLVFIVPNKPYKANDIILMLKDGETYLRRYKKLNNIILFQAESANFDSFAFTNNELKKSSLTIIGPVEHLKTRTKL